MSKRCLYNKMLMIEQMAAHATNWGLSPADMAVFIRIVSLYNAGKDKAWPSNNKLAAEVGVTVRQVQRSTCRLVAAGLLEKIQGGRGHGDSNRYRPYFDRITSTKPFEDAARLRVTNPSPYPDELVTPTLTNSSPNSFYPSPFRNIPSDLSPSAAFHGKAAFIGDPSSVEHLGKGEIKRHLDHIAAWLKAAGDSCPVSELPRVRQWSEFCTKATEVYDTHTGDPIGGMAYRLADQLYGFLQEEPPCTAPHPTSPAAQSAGSTGTASTRISVDLSGYPHGRKFGPWLGEVRNQLGVQMGELAGMIDMSAGDLCNLELGCMEVGRARQQQIVDRLSEVRDAPRERNAR